MRRCAWFLGVVLTFAVPVWAGINSDGVDDDVDCGNAAGLQLGSGDFTLAWKGNSQTSGNTFFGFGGQGTGGKRAELRISVGKGQFSLDDNVINPSVVDSTGPTITNTTFCLVGVRNGTNARLYVNGGTESASSPTDITGLGSLTSACGVNLIGNYNEADCATAATPVARVDEAAIWHAVLTGQEIERWCNGNVKLAALDIQPSSLKATWALLDEEDGSSANGDTFLDYSGNGNHCTGDDGADNAGFTAVADNVNTWR